MTHKMYSITVTIEVEDPPDMDLEGFKWWISYILEQEGLTFTVEGVELDVLEEDEEV